MEWFRPLEDIRFSNGVVGFRKDKTYACQNEDKTHYFVSTVPNDENCNQVCKFPKKEEGKLYEFTCMQYK